MKKIFFLIAFTIISVANVIADSPLTETNFYKAYLDVPMVQQALKSKGRLSHEMILYLANDTNALDIKLAIINALGWNHKGRGNSSSYLNYVVKTKKYKGEAKSITFKWFATSDELTCYSYLLSMDNYFDIINANEIAQLALKKSPNSYAVNMIACLIKSQGLFLLGEECYSFKLFNTLKTNNQLKMDMRNDAEKYLFEYMNSIGTNCK
jgi:hypothetical protein